MINTIRKIKETLSQLFFSPEATGTWSVGSTDHKAVSLPPLKQEPAYTGVPAPVYLKDDEWFGPAPVRSEKQLKYMKQETLIKQEQAEASESIESEDIHQRMYEIATSSAPTTVQFNPPGGSENFQDSGWMSGKRS